MKSWYQSKLVWLGVIQTLIGSLGLVATYLADGVYTPEKFVLLASGILTVILRVWFTDSPVV